MALSKWFWDTTCTFHFSGIGEVMLTPYDFSTITGMKLGGERIEGHDTISPTEVKTYLDVNPSRVSGRNVSLMWLFSNIERCKSVEIGTQMFMLLFIGTLLCLDLGSTVSLRYLWSLRNINRIKDYDWGSMAYTTLLHFMTQLSRRSLSSLRGAPIVWQVRFEFLVMYILQRLFVLLLTFLDDFVLQVLMYEYFEVGPQLLEDVVVEFSRFLHWMPKNRLSMLL